jgi:23S rRNA pseudouridine1911/1915/1917 synthase
MASAPRGCERFSPRVPGSRVPQRAFEVGPGEAGERLDRLAARRLDLSRSAVRRLLDGGSLLVAGRRENASYKVRDGEVVEASVPEEGLAPEEIAVPVVFEDEHLLVVDKPAGLVVHPGAGNPS